MLDNLRIGTNRAALAALAVVSAALASCATKPDSQLVVSVKDQKMLLVKEKQPVAVYDVSTSKFGLGDKPRSCCTPLGKMEVAEKIGDGAPVGAVFKSRRFTGEVLSPDAPGRDPIVTRILWLDGKERSNRNAFGRYIYIHGTPEERNIGRPASYGCIRMRSRDIIDLYDRVPVGTEVVVTENALGRAARKVIEPPSIKPLPPELHPQVPGSTMLAGMPTRSASPPAPQITESEKDGLLQRAVAAVRRAERNSQPSVAPEPVSSSTAAVSGSRDPQLGPPSPPAPTVSRNDPPAGSDWRLSREEARRLFMMQK